jgi:hypothetical protein
MGTDQGILCDMDTPNLGTCFGFDNGTMVVQPGGDKITKPPDCPNCPLYIGGNGTESKPEPREQQGLR